MRDQECYCVTVTYTIRRSVDYDDITGHSSARWVRTQWAKMAIFNL